MIANWVTTALADTDEYVGTSHNPAVEIDGVGEPDETEGGGVAEPGNVVDISEADALLLMEP